MTADEKYQLAVLFWKNNALENAWNLFFEVYREGHILAGASIGDFYYYGVWGENNFLEAIRWFMIGANVGVPKYYYAVGSAYHQMHNCQEAVIWYIKAANLGYSYVCYVLGYMYENGDGVIKDESLAAQYYQQCAARGNSDCIIALSLLNST